MRPRRGIFQLSNSGNRRRAKKNGTAYGKLWMDLRRVFPKFGITFSFRPTLGYQVHTSVDTRKIKISNDSVWVWRRAG